MKKRLLAVLLACCMAAGMANAVFAADELPATAESAAALAPAAPDPPAPAPEIEAAPPPAPGLKPSQSPQWGRRFRRPFGVKMLGNYLSNAAKAAVAFAKPSA